MRAVHPDLNSSPDAAAAAAAVTSAYRMLAEHPPDRHGETKRKRRAASGARRPSTPAAGVRRATAGPARRHVRAQVTGADSVAIEGSREEAFAAILEASHRLGEIGYLDPGVAMVEVVVEFTEAPTSSLVMSLQGRASGTVEVFCTVEPLSGGESPPIDAVTRLLAATLTGIEVTDLAV